MFLILAADVLEYAFQMARETSANPIKIVVEGVCSHIVKQSKTHRHKIKDLLLAYFTCYLGWVPMSLICLEDVFE
jgi:hypothetical protein